MSPMSGKIENIALQAMESEGFDQKYRVEKSIMSTGLYSVFLISERDQLKAKDKVLLIEHLPANEPTAHILPIQIRESASKTETMKQITDAVEDHFDRKDDVSY